MKKEENLKKVDLPYADEAPVVSIPRFDQPLSGLISLLFTFIISLILWWIFFDPRWHPEAVETNGVLLGGYGLIGVIWAIWFANWPYYKKFDSLWKIGLIGTLINLVIAVVFTFVITPLFANWYSSMLGITDPEIALYTGAAVLGPLSATCFSFANTWVAGSMFWPYFKEKNPKRGIYLWIIGTAINVAAWFLLFFDTGSPGAASKASAVCGRIPFIPVCKYAISMGWTQWMIFFTLLTMYALEYWPWTKLGKKQPQIGIYGFIGCAILGLLFSLIFPYIVALTIDPIFVSLGGVPPGSLERFSGWYLISISLAVFLVTGVVVVGLFFDNWPRKYTQKVNFIIRTILSIVIGLVLFFGYYLTSSWLVGDDPNFWRKTPTDFMVFFLWIQLLFAIIWRKWPIFKKYEV